jgi:hypothetical protein
MLKIFNRPLEGSDARDYRSRKSGHLRVSKTCAKFLRRTKNTGPSR